MDDFILRALLAGIGIAMVVGPFGCVLVWRRMAFFGEALAHGGLLGIAGGFALGIGPMPALMVFCAVAALLIATAQRQRSLPGDAILAIVAHTALALGLVVVYMMDNVRVDLMSFLIGDILAISDADLYVVAGSIVLGLGGLYVMWRPVLAIVVNEDLARMDGIAVERTNAIMMVLTALVIAVAVKLVGILLVVALMIIPAGAARRMARTPEQMVVWSMVVGMLSVAAGMGASLQWDTQTGPSIVVAAALLLGIVWSIAPRRS